MYFQFLNIDDNKLEVFKTLNMPCEAWGPDSVCVGVCTLCFMPAKMRYSWGGLSFPHLHPRHCQDCKAGIRALYISSSSIACSFRNVLHCRCFAHRFYLDIDYILADVPALPIMLMNEKMLPNIPPAWNHRTSELEGPFRDHIVQNFSNVYF